MSKPLAIDLFCGLGGWTEGLLAAGWDVVGFDIERHRYFVDGVWHQYPAQLVLQDVMTIHGKQFASADLIVASPPCQRYSYMAMPWSRAKAVAAQYRENIGDLNDLFNACFRIQREACEAAGRHIPMVVENVRGAQPWVGRAVWNYGSFYLWGDLPALMPIGQAVKVPTIGQGRRTAPGLGTRFTSRDSGVEHDRNACAARKFASAQIAKIPRALSEHIGRVFHPGQKQKEAAA